MQLIDTVLGPGAWLPRPMPPPFLACADGQTPPTLCEGSTLYPRSTPTPVTSPCHPVPSGHSLSELGTSQPQLQPGAPSSWRDSLPASFLGKFQDQLFMKEPFPRVWAPHPSEQGRAKGFSNTKLQWWPHVSSEPQDPLLLMRSRDTPGVGRGWILRVSMDKGPNSHTHSCLTHPPLSSCPPEQQVTFFFFPPKE